MGLFELQNLRHWVTNRIAPSGWDQSKIATMALNCSHPREDELKRPVPQTNMRAIMGDGGSKSHSQSHSQNQSQSSLEGPHSARGIRAKLTPGAFLANHLAKQAPHSARCLGASGTASGVP